MPKKQKPKKFVTAALLSVIASSVVVTSAMTNAEGDTSRTVVSYAGASANPYQQILPYQPGVYTPTGTSVQTTSSSKAVFPKAVLLRKIKQLERKAKGVHRRLIATEEKIEILERTMQTATRDRADLQDSLTRLQKTQIQLSNQFAELNADIANFQLQLKDAT